MTTACPAAPGTAHARPELAEVFRRFGPAYLRIHRVSPEQARALRHIIVCRTPALGGHADTCDHCGQTWRSYNSCRDRHCPLCQGLQQQRWIERRMKRLVPTHHFHVVFTVPEGLRPLMLANRKRLYDLFFHTVRDTLLELARSRWDAVPAITAVLHTWTRQMQYHPHLHCIVTGGGLTDDDGWVAAKPNFLFPVRVMGALFRGKFLDQLVRLYNRGELRCVGTSAPFADPAAFADLRRSLYDQSWVVYAKRPFAGTEQVLAYLGLYTHRVAIAPSRILAVDDHAITFKTRGRDTCTLTPDEFIRRFLLHVLPHGLNKIRHYGIAAPANVNTRLATAQDLVAGYNRAQRRASPATRPTTPPRSTQCPACQVGRLIRRRIPPARGPPGGAP